MKLTWKEPPEKIRGGGRKAIISPELIAVLKKRRNRWARIVGPRLNRGIQSMAHQWRQKFQELEIVTRAEADGYYIYARYVGNGKVR